MNEEKKFFIGLLSGMLCIGTKFEYETIGEPMLEDVMIMDFHPNQSELKMMLQNPLPFNFVNKKTQKLQRMSIPLSSFTYLLNLNDVEDSEKLVQYYFECLLNEERDLDLRKETSRLESLKISEEIKNDK